MGECCPLNLEEKFEYGHLERFFLYFERKVDILLKLYSDDFEQKYLKNKNNPES